MDAPADVIDRFLARADIRHRRLADDTWALQLSGERKLTIPVSLTLRDGVLSIQSFFMRKPQENAERLSQMLLRRNARAYGVHFAIDSIGDVYLVGTRAARGIDEDELDRIFGALLIEADGLFDAAIAVGFESYLAADLRWRTKAARDREA